MDSNEITERLDSAINLLERIELDGVDTGAAIDIAARASLLSRLAKQFDFGVKRDIKKALGDRDSGSVRGQEYEARMSTSNVRKVNLDRLREERPDIAFEFTDTSEQQRIVYVRVGQNSRSVALSRRPWRSAAA